MTHRLAGLALLLSSAASAQTIGPDELRFNTTPYVATPAVTIRTEVQLVEVPVVVRDSRHKGVAGLKQSDFTLYDAGKKQQITAFTVETFEPHSTATAPSSATPSAPADTPKADSPRRLVAICLDDLNTDAESLQIAKKAARQFVQTSPAPGDRVAVVTTAWQHDIEFSDDVATLLARIDKVQNNSRVYDNVAMQCPPIKVYEAYLIANHLDESVLQAKIDEAKNCMSVPGTRSTQIDMIAGFATSVWERALSNNKDTLRVLEALVDGMGKLPGRRMILMASSGFLSGNLQDDEEQLIAKAVRAGVVINTLGARGVYTVIPFGDGSEVRSTMRRSRTSPQTEAVNQQNNSRSQAAKDDGMAVLASGTGGTFFHDNNDLLNGFRQLGMAPDVLYVLGFSPGDPVTDGRFHALKVQIPSAGHYSVQARIGYYAPSKPKPVAVQPTPESRLDNEMRAGDTLSDLPARITWEADTQKHQVTYTARIDLNALKLGAHDDRRTQTITLVAALRDANGNIVAGKRSDVELNLKSDTFARLVAAGGLRIALTVDAPPGTYTARGVLVDGLDGKMTTSSWEIRLQ